MWTTCELKDKREILGFLDRDRLYAAYAIGDLEPGLFEDCTWAGAVRDGGVQALVLHYRGLDPPALFLMAAPSSPDASVAGLRAILSGELRPERVYITCLPGHLELVREFYDWQAAIPMWRMALPAGGFRPVDSGGCLRLATEDALELEALYAQGGAVAFSLDQVGRGVYFGLRDHGRLVAAAGTHLVSRRYGVAAVGNVYTEPQHRGQGYGTMTTSAVVGELLAAGIGDIVLNVGQENSVALRIYERLGFERYCAFLEGPATKPVTP